MNKSFIYLFLLIIPLSSIAKRQAKPADVLLEEYPTFVAQLAENVKDPKFLAALRAGDRNRDKVKFETSVAYAASALRPTQNEIDIEKSLKWPLSKEQCGRLALYLKANNGDAISIGAPIVTAGGKYVIDGHHRWAQIYLINPDAKISAVNMKINEPLDALKFTQMAIASVAESIPISVVNGQNVLTMDKRDFDRFIENNIAPCSIKVFSDFGIVGVSNIADYIWSNAKRMQQDNAPIEGAFDRGHMPQTDRASGWLDALKTGTVPIRS